MKLFATIVSLSSLLYLVSTDIPFLNKLELDKQLKKGGITIVEFYADWNKLNAVEDLKHLKDCKVFRVNIDEHPELREEYNIVVVPTIVMFKKGEEIKRYQANLMFKMCSKSFSCKKVQENINNQIMQKFR